MGRPMDSSSISDLVASIRRVLSSRYVEDRSSPFGAYVRSDGGLRFEELSRSDQRDVLINAPFWGWQDDEGMTHAEQLIIVGNVLDGKPQEKWLEGVCEQPVDA